METQRQTKALAHDENCVIVKSLIREDQRVKVREIVEVTGTAKSTVHEIIPDLNSVKCLLTGF
jgi:hypothetical protein